VGCLGPPPPTWTLSCVGDRQRGRLRHDGKAGLFDYDDGPAPKLLVDALTKDGTAILRVLDGRELEPALAKAGASLATVLGEDGVFTIARRVAPDRVISTVDPQARHGHKTSAHRFDGYKGTSRLTRTPRSSPRPRSPRATPATRPQPWGCSTPTFPTQPAPPTTQATTWPTTAARLASQVDRKGGHFDVIPDLAHDLGLAIIAGL
jgi:hypothetical protein